MMMATKVCCQQPWTLLMLQRQRQGPKNLQQKLLVLQQQHLLQPFAASFSTLSVAKRRLLEQPKGLRQKGSESSSSFSTSSSSSSSWCNKKSNRNVTYAVAAAIGIVLTITQSTAATTTPSWSPSSPLCEGKLPVSDESENNENTKTSKKKMKKKKSESAEPAPVHDDAAAAEVEPVVGMGTGEVVDNVDPYDNLPETDEPTDCFLCNTHRQGPCRPLWRKFEYCVKDLTKRKQQQQEKEQQQQQETEQQQEENSEQSASPCDQYALPFQQCWFQYFDLYHLIVLNVQQTMAPLKFLLKYDLLDSNNNNNNNHETDKKKINADDDDDDVYEWHIDNNSDDTVVQWKEWHDFVAEQDGAVLEYTAEQVADWPKHFLTTTTTSGEKKPSPQQQPVPPLWERYYRLEVKPVVVNVPAMVPIHPPISSTPSTTTTPGQSEMEKQLLQQQIRQEKMILRLAFAVDQDNQVLGLVDYGPNEDMKQKLISEQASAASSSANTTDITMSTANNSNSNEEPQNGVKLEVTLLPGMTESIQINAFYCETKHSNSKNNGKDTDAPATSKSGLDCVLYKTRQTPLPKSSSV